MPAWTGWDENTIREHKKPTGAPAMEAIVSSVTMSADGSPAPIVMGFTAINAPKPGNRHSSKTSKGLNEDHTKGAATHVGSPSSQARSVASEYLGRGDGDAVTPAAEHTTRVTRGSTAKKKANASKKRAATTPSQPASKRRKISDVSDSMPVTKPKPSKGKAKPKAKKPSEYLAGADNADIPSSQPVPLFSSSTSMETLSTPLQQTSLDAVRASHGFGTTLYHGPQARTGGQFTTVIAKPWLGPQTVRSQHDSSAHQPQVVSTTHEAARDADATGSPTDPQSKLNRRRILSSRRISEDFMTGEDDGLEEAMALADSLERRPEHGQKARSYPMTKSSTHQRKSKGKMGNCNLGQAGSDAQMVDSSKTMSESFIIGDDEDMDEALAVVERLETSSSPQDGRRRRRRRPPTEGKKCSATAKYSEATRRKSSPPPESAQATDQPPDAEDDPIDNTSCPIEVDASQRPPTPPARQWKLNMREVDEHEDYGGALLSVAEKNILDSLKTNQEDSLTPIVRTSFPRPILDRSPLFGASSNTTLRTCFRIGEALKEGTTAVRNNHNTIIELYARVVASHREGRKQHFVFHDLYHDRPPYLEGVCELWNQSKLWELDTRKFLHAAKKQEGVMCRVVARLKRVDGVNGKGNQWRLEVMSVWEAGWEDVDFVAGIYGKNRDEAGGEE